MLQTIVDAIIFQMSFSVIKYAPFLFKIGKDLNMIIKKTKALEIGEIHLKTHLKVFASNH
jgi:hypothetical protein